MIDYRNLNNNIRAIRWKARYDALPDTIRLKLDILAGMKEEEYQLQEIKRTRLYPEIGDIFKVCPRENINYYGIVVNNHVDNNNGKDLIVIFLFNDDTDIEQAIKKGINKRDLLIDPEIVGKEYWTRGLFYTVGHTEINVDNYGFYSIGKSMFLDEYGNKIDEEPYLMGTYGVSTISGIAYNVNKEMIINGII